MWVNHGDIIAFKKQDPECDFKMLNEPHLVTGVAQYTHGIINLTFMDKTGKLVNVTTNTRFIKNVAE